ncbi:ribose 5-phosphate isomerase B [Alphaproteobacteria bacterium]|nr:ribose 5-phosphate isomerase B [Alphaproteobacteria bacterium]
MHIFIASDHAGVFLKKFLVESLKDIDINDVGPFDMNPCDYPELADKFVNELLSSKYEKKYGILICGTGIGMSIAANRYDGIRAALCLNREMAVMARRHNNANVIVFGEKYIDANTALECVRDFQKTEFDGGRHEARLRLIDDLTKGRRK